MHVTDLAINRALGMQLVPADGPHLLEMSESLLLLNHLGPVHASAQFALAEACSGEWLLRHADGAPGRVLAVLRNSEIKFRKQANGALRATARFADGAAEPPAVVLAARGAGVGFRACRSDGCTRHRHHERMLRLVFAARGWAGLRQSAVLMKASYRQSTTMIDPLAQMLPIHPAKNSAPPGTWNRTSGVLGVLGALLLFIGDMLFYGHWGPGADFWVGMLAAVRQASLMRLFVGGLLGLPAACLVLLGCWHVGQNVAARSPWLGRVVFGALAAMTVAIGAVHVLWVPRGLALREAARAQGSAPELLAALHDYWAAADACAQVPGYLAALLLLGLVSLGRTRYPRWTVSVNPGLLQLVAEPLAHFCPAPLGAALVGGFGNLALALFFLVSVATTWKGGDT